MVRMSLQIAHRYLRYCRLMPKHTVHIVQRSPDLYYILCDRSDARV